MDCSGPLADGLLTDGLLTDGLLADGLLCLWCILHVDCYAGGMLGQELG